MKINDLGNWPEKKQINDPMKDSPAEIRGYNIALDEVGGLEVTVDINQLALKLYHGNNKTSISEALKKAKTISSTLQQWLVLKGGKHEQT